MIVEKTTFQGKPNWSPGKCRAWEPRVEAAENTAAQGGEISLTKRSSGQEPRGWTRMVSVKSTWVELNLSVFSLFFIVHRIKVPETAFRLFQTHESIFKHMSSIQSFISYFELYLARSLDGTVFLSSLSPRISPSFVLSFLSTFLSSLFLPVVLFLSTPRCLSSVSISHSRLLQRTQLWASACVLKSLILSYLI